jgi:hypothetical protein
MHQHLNHEQAKARNVLGNYLGPKDALTEQVCLQGVRWLQAMTTQAMSY